MNLRRRLVKTSNDATGPDVTWCSRIKGDGAAHIDTGFCPNPATTSLETTFVPRGGAGSTIGLLGSRHAGVPSKYCSIFQNTWNASAMRIDWGWDGDGNSIYNPNCYYSIGSTYHIYCNGPQVTVNGEVFLNTKGKDNIYLAYPIWLFNLNNQGSRSFTASNGEIGQTLIWDNGILVRDLRPCINADGEVGMWDMVQNKFYGNAYSRGSFTAIY